MKRKSGRKSSKKEEDGANGVDTKAEQNGDTSDHDEEESPKKRKSSKISRKSVSFSAKKDESAVESEDSGDQEDDEDKKEDKKSSKSGRKAGKKEETDESQESEDDEDDVQEKKKNSKKGNKKAKVASKEDAKEKVAQDSDNNQDEDDETQYEVETVLDEKIIKGVRHYLIRWKGYEEESDTWEPEDTLDCSRLIQEFKEKKKKKGGKLPKSLKKEKKDSKGPQWDENEAFEVDRILEVHHRKDGKREFLVSWKGYGQAENSWEPEENMDCKDMIERFMVKVEKARDTADRELRVNRQHVQRYTLCTPDSGRRLSKRFRGKERVQYHGTE